jgi:hypothetical protein
MTNTKTAEQYISPRCQAVFASISTRRNLNIFFSPTADVATANLQTGEVILPIYENCTPDIVDGATIREICRVLFSVDSEGNSWNIDKVVTAMSQSLHPSISPLIIKNMLRVCEEVRFEALGRREWAGVSGILTSLYRDLVAGPWKDQYRSLLSSRIDDRSDELETFVARMNDIAFWSKVSLSGVTVYFLDSETRALYNKFARLSTMEKIEEFVFSQLKQISDNLYENDENDEESDEMWSESDEFDSEGGTVYSGGNTAYTPDDNAEFSVTVNKENPDELELDLSAGDLTEGVETAEGKNRLSYDDGETVQSSRSNISGSEYGHLESDPLSFAFLKSKTESKTSDYTQNYTLDGDAAERCVIPVATVYGELESQFETNFANVTNRGISPATVKEIYMELLWQNYYTLNRDVVSSLLARHSVKKAAMVNSLATVSQTGRIDHRKVANAYTRSDIFRQKINLPIGDSHGMFILVDWSGSMVNKIGSTIVQMINLAWFCRKANMPMRVLGFRDGAEDFGNVERNMDNYLNVADAKKNIVSTRGMALLEMFSSDMSDMEFRRMAKMWLAVAQAEFDYAGSPYRITDEQIIEACRTHGITDEQNIRDMWMPAIRQQPFMTYNNGAMKLPNILTMNGTPLYRAMVASVPLMHRFRQRFNTKRCCFCILSDGEDTGGIRFQNARFKDRYEALKYFGDMIDPGRTKNIKVNLREVLLDEQSGTSLNVGEKISMRELAAFVRGATECNMVFFSLVEASEANHSYRRNTIKTQKSRYSSAISASIVYSGNYTTTGQFEEMYKDAHASVISAGYAVVPSDVWDSYIIFPASRSRALFTNTWEQVVERIYGMKRVSKKAMQEAMATGNRIRNSSSAVASSVVDGMNAILDDEYKKAL